MRAPVGSRSWAFHSATFSATVVITRSLIAEIAPVASAVGMNTEGGIGPCTGWCQRTSASAAATSPVRRSMIGW